ncbi:radical SAM protein [Megasphaera paucivorans]|uniref:Radical SAM core domain-containing protein n=1 Tax=Megasphaera paucivorans TaxID=349095 RepID=A0A1G9XU66_9FIRM|nr:radical SAM (seleno)protein TrsS [Megasphaera paucivorans]SDN00347.1 hypothetical protein SAMN05660299_01928 [Megasphaera paucivorans]
MTKDISRTQSVCPVCLQVVNANILQGKDGNIYMQKRCPEHGVFTVLLWEGSMEEYLSWGTYANNDDVITAPRPVDKGCPYDCGLCQGHQSNGCCVLLELTNRCNLSCPVCFADSGSQNEHDMTLREISDQYDMLMDRGGPFNIQLSGGEPTLRDDLPEIIQLGRKKGFTFFQLNTNGIRLAEEKEYAHALKTAGLSCVFLQFDGFANTTFMVLRGKLLLEIKQQAIEHCRQAGLGVILVPVIAPGININEIGALLRFAVNQMPVVRGVHFQPVSYFGRCVLKNSAWRITIPRMLREIEKQTKGCMKQSDFSGGGAENPYCSFHASYMRFSDRSLQALSPRYHQGCCIKASEARDFVARQWSGSNLEDLPIEKKCCKNSSMENTDSLDEFLVQAKENTFTVSGMLFQDAYNLDLRRLRRCYICEVDSTFGMVPFCAYNITDGKGKALYRR